MSLCVLNLLFLDTRSQLLEHVFIFFFLGLRSEIKSQEDAGCQNRHVWQHQPSDAAQRCSSRCSQGKWIVCETGGCIKKKKVDTVFSVLFSVAGCATAHPRQTLAASLRISTGSSSPRCSTGARGSSQSPESKTR